MESTMSRCRWSGIDLCRLSGVSRLRKPCMIRAVIAFQALRKRSLWVHAADSATLRGFREAAGAAAASPAIPRPSLGTRPPSLPLASTQRRLCGNVQPPDQLRGHLVGARSASLSSHHRLERATTGNCRGRLHDTVLHVFVVARLRPGLGRLTMRDHHDLDQPGR